MEEVSETQQNYTTGNVIKMDAKVIVAYHHNKPVGRGCFRKAEDPGTVEMKRIYVIETERGSGIATMIVNELEKWAVDAGYDSAILETRYQSTRSRHFIH